MCIVSKIAGRHRTSLRDFPIEIEAIRINVP
jgi:hypothetical protein